jgi:aspartyl protease family protein
MAPLNGSVPRHPALARFAKHYYVQNFPNRFLTWPAGLPDLMPRADKKMGPNRPQDLPACYDEWRLSENAAGLAQAAAGLSPVIPIEFSAAMCYPPGNSLTRAASLCAITVGVLCGAGIGRAADESDPRGQLQQRGIVVTSAGLSLRDENDFRRSVNESRDRMKGLRGVEGALASGQREAARFDEEMLAARQQLLVISAQLATLPDAARGRNQVVAHNNALVAKLGVMRARRPILEAQMDELRKAATVKREEYVEYLLTLREQAQRIDKLRSELAQDKEVQQLIASLNRQAGKKYELAPSKTFQLAQKRLTELEQAVLSEDIPLRRDGNSFFAPVVLNGQYVQEMVVDSGASIISLPFKIAMEAGIKPTADDPDIALTVADGRQIRGKLVKLKSVRVGQFLAEDVEAAVMDVSGPGAEPLLGMSFLGRYKFELSAQASRLSLLRVLTGPDEKSKK